MIIKKFNEFISEQLWSKGIERSKQNIKRTEDKFSESDLYELDRKSIYGLLEDLNIYNIANTEYTNLLIDTYKDPIKKWVYQHGTLELNFSKEDKCDLPDFHWSFIIEELKDVTVFVDYIHSDGKIDTFCGNGKPEYDISDLTLGKFLIKKFYKVIKDVLEDEPDLMFKNLKMNFDEFKKLLSEYVYSCCYNELEYNINNNQSLSPLGSVEIIPEDSETKLNRFLFNGVEFLPGNRKEVVLCGKNITYTKEGKEILNIYNQQYELAKQEIEKMS